MLYTVGEMAKILKVAPSTLRYYDKEGLLPFVERSGGGIRMFKDEDFSWLYIIECLKKAGMSVKEIKIFIDLCMEGDSAIEQRLELIDHRREIVCEQIKEMQNTLHMLNYKHWYYETAKKEGTVSVPKNMTVEELPEEHRRIRLELQKMPNKNI